MPNIIHFKSQEGAIAWVSESLRKEQRLEVIIINHDTNEEVHTTMNPEFAIYLAKAETGA